MGNYVGFDPGGINAFGWAVLSGEALPLQVMGSGVESHAQGAFDKAFECASSRIQAVGIDAPLFWRADGDRIVDQTLRTAITKLGSHSATVGHVNALQGACLVQGILVAHLCRQNLSADIPITESHPKALLWLLGIANVDHKPNVVSVNDLFAYLTADGEALTDQERDAALGAFAAFAMHSRQEGWQDLYPLETNQVTPISAPLGYWMPRL